MLCSWFEDNTKQEQIKNMIWMIHKQSWKSAVEPQLRDMPQQAARAAADRT
jgi:hypothetical protein